MTDDSYSLLHVVAGIFGGMLIAFPTGLFFAVALKQEPTSLLETQKELTELHQEFEESVVQLQGQLNEKEVETTEALRKSAKLSREIKTLKSRLHETVNSKHAARRVDMEQLREELSRFSFFNSVSLAGSAEKPVIVALGGEFQLHMEFTADGIPGELKAWNIDKPITAAINALVEDPKFFEEFDKFLEVIMHPYGYPPSAASLLIDYSMKTGEPRSLMFEDRRPIALSCNRGLGGATTFYVWPKWGSPEQ